MSLLVRRLRTGALVVACLAVLGGLGGLVAIGGPDPRQWPDAIERRGRVRRLRAAVVARNKVVASQVLVEIPGTASPPHVPAGVRMVVQPRAIEIDNIPTFEAWSDEELASYAASRTTEEMREIPYVDDDVVRLRAWKPERDEARPEDWKDNFGALRLVPVGETQERASKHAFEALQALPSPPIDIGGGEEPVRAESSHTDLYVHPSAPYGLVARLLLSSQARISLVVRRGGGLHRISMSENNCPELTFAISPRGISVGARLSRDYMVYKGGPLDPIVADDRSAPLVPRLPGGQDIAKLTTVLRVMRPLIDPCSARGTTVEVAAVPDAPWSEVAPILVVAEDELGAGVKLARPTDEAAINARPPLTLADLADRRRRP